MDRRRSASLTVLVFIAGFPGMGNAAMEGNDPTPRVVRVAGSHPALPMGAQDLRGNPAALAFGSGVAAGHALIAGRLSAGDHLLMPDSSYVGIAELARFTEGF